MKKILLVSTIIITSISIVLGTVLLFMGKYMNDHDDKYFY